MLILLGAATALGTGALAFVSGGGLWFIPALAGLACLAAGFIPSPRRTQVRAAVVGLVAIPVFTLIVFGLDEYTRRPRRPICIVLPRGYRGEFSIIKDSRHGRPLVLKGGAWTFEIPPDGVLRVEDTWPFFVPHWWQVVDEDGTPARVEDLGASGPNIPAGADRTSSNRDDGSVLRWRAVGVR